MFEELDFVSPEIINEALAAVRKFQNMTLQEFLALSPQERGFMGGAIIGNYSAHHPEEAFKLLKRLWAVGE